MANADPLDLAAANRVGQRVQRVANQGKYLLYADLLERADKLVCDCFGHIRLLECWQTLHYSARTPRVIKDSEVVYRWLMSY